VNRVNFRQLISFLILALALAACQSTSAEIVEPEPAAPQAPAQEEALTTEAEAEEAAAEVVAEEAEGMAKSPYAGETIEVIIPFSEGGGSESWLRSIVPFLEKNLGDDVTIVVTNMPGESGMVGANEFAVRDPDGLTLLVTSGSNALPYLLGQEAVQYDFVNFSGVIGSPSGGVVYVSSDTGISAVAGLCNSDAELIYGGIAATGLDMVPLLAFDLMGVEFCPILGYNGRGATWDTFRQGEINLDFQTTPTYFQHVQPFVYDLLDEGSVVVPLFTFGILDESGNIADDPVFDELPNVQEAIEICAGSTSGPEFEAFKAAFTAGFGAQKNLWVHGDAPQDKIDALNAAAQMVIADPQFQVVASDLVGNYEFYAGADAVGTAFGAASQMSDEALEWLKGFLNENYEAGLK
jgi:tripartite-type tricarboxylate transporter receptor subunit TctC